MGPKLHPWSSFLQAAIIALTFATGMLWCRSVSARELREPLATQGPVVVNAEAFIATPEVQKSSQPLVPAPSEPDQKPKELPFELKPSVGTRLCNTHFEP